MSDADLTPIACSCCLGNGSPWRPYSAQCLHAAEHRQLAAVHNARSAKLEEGTMEVAACPFCGGPVRHTCEDCGETFYGHGSSMRLSTRRFAPALRAAKDLLREARTHVHTLDAAWGGPWWARVAAALGEVDIELRRETEPLSRLRAFAKRVLDDARDGACWDGGDIQQLAVE